MFAVTSFSMPRKSGGFGGVAGSLMDYVNYIFREEEKPLKSKDKYLLYKIVSALKKYIIFQFIRE